MTIELEKRPMVTDVSVGFRQGWTMFRWGLFFAAAAVLAFLFGVGHNFIKSQHQQLVDDRTELAQWREASSECAYMKSIADVERLEAACYREAFQKGESLEKAADQCHSTIDQCDTMKALKK